MKESAYDMTRVKTDSFTVHFKIGLRLPDAIDASCSPAGWNIQVDMRRLQRVFPNSKASDIFLGKESCPGSLHGDVLTFSNGLHESLCETTETVVAFTFSLAISLHTVSNRKAGMLF